MSDKNVRAVSAWEGHLLRRALADSFRKLDPRAMVKNPVMFVVEIGSVLTTLIWLHDLMLHPAGVAPAWFTGNVTLWLWFTVLFANFAEALAEGRGKAQAAALRGLRQETVARKLVDGREERVAASTLRKGDVVVVEAGETIPGDGEVTSRASRPSTSRRSPASRPPSSARAAATAPRSPGAPASSPTASWSGSGPTRASRSSTGSSASSRGRSGRRPPTRSRSPFSSPA